MRDREVGREPLRAAVVVALALALYLFTAAPGLLWGDAAKFQRMAATVDLRFDERGHPLWVLLAAPFARVPWLDPARACNLLSAMLSALALWPAWRVTRRLGASVPAAAVACLALAVSHTYWFHAAIAEVYALNSLLMLGLLDFATLRVGGGRASPRPAWAWAAVGVGCGLAAANHHLVLLWVPGLALLLIREVRNRAAAIMSLPAAAAGLAAGFAPALVLRSPRTGAEPLGDLVARLAAQFVHPEGLAADLMLDAAYVLYQFPVPIILAAAAAGARRVPRLAAIGLMTIVAACALFALRFPAADRYAFFLPAYLPLAVLAGPGLDALLERMGGRLAGRRRRVVAWLAAAALCVAAPPVVYSLSPALLELFAPARTLPLRDLPLRDEARFHLLPSKRGDDGARRFCEEALAVMPWRSVFIADFSIGEPMKYLQIVEGRRPDLDVFYASHRRQLEVALKHTAEGRAVFIGAADRYYNIAALSSRFRIVPAGPVFRLDLR